MDFVQLLEKIKDSQTIWLELVSQAVGWVTEQWILTFLLPGLVAAIWIAIIAYGAKKGKRVQIVRKHIGKNWAKYALASLIAFALMMILYIRAEVPSVIRSQQTTIAGQLNDLHKAIETQTAQYVTQQQMHMEYASTLTAIFEESTFRGETAEATTSYEAWLFEDFTSGTLRRSVWMPFGCPLSNRSLGTFGYLGFSLDETVWQCILWANLDTREVRTIVVDLELIDTSRSTGFLGIETSCGPNKIYFQLHDTQVVFQRDQETSQESFYHDMANPRVRLEMRWLDRGVIDLNAFDSKSGAELRVLPEITCRALPEYVNFIAYRQAGDFSARIYTIELSSDVKD